MTNKEKTMKTRPETVKTICPPPSRERHNVHPHKLVHHTRISKDCIWTLRDMDYLYDMPPGTAASMALAIGMQHMLKASKFNHNLPQDMRDAIKFQLDGFARYLESQRQTQL
jgi:hypothetical protein